METLYDAYETDADKENGAGVDLDFGKLGVITINRAGGANKRFQRAVAELQQDYQDQISNDAIEDDEGFERLARVYAKTVLVGWKGIKGRDGKPLTFNEKNVVKLLTDLPDFFAVIRARAMEVATFRKKQAEQTAKNSDGASAST